MSPNAAGSRVHATSPSPASRFRICQIPSVLCVDARAAGFCLGLTDEMGRGIRSVFYEVEVRELEARHRREQRIRGIGDFAELRQQRMPWLVRDGE